MTTSSFELSFQLVVGEALKRARFNYPKLDAVVDGEVSNKRITYEQLDDRATNLAGWIQAQGVEAQEKVAMIMKNSVEFVEVLFGSQLSGAVTVPVNFRLSAEEFKYILGNSDSKILFVHDEFQDAILSIKDDLPLLEKIVIIGNNEHEDHFVSYESIFESEYNYHPCNSINFESPAVIMYTSGTTGRPKGAVLTQRNIMINVFNLLTHSTAEKHDATLISPPQFHIAGLLLTIRSVALAGKTVILREFNPVKILENIQNEQIHIIMLVPAMWNFLLQVPNIGDYDLTSVKNCATGASIAPITLKKAILKHFPNAELSDSFGQTETTATAISITGEDAINKPGSVGTPYLTVEYRIVDENMNDVPDGEVGEIVYRGPTVMKEYYKNPEATAEAFRGGWFHSGDLVKRDEDGFVYVVDRKNDMIVSGGENIYPAEVEEVIFKMPEVLEVAVFGVPDDEWEENVHAAVVLKPGEALTEDDVIEYCKENLASYKKPKFVHFIDALPRNTTGKVLKFVLREQYAKQVNK